jgi:two-component system LytT family response regulator
VTPAKPLRVLVADDERLARQRLEDLLAHEANIEIVARTDNGLTTVAAIRELEPDLVFLDIQMPGKTGLEVVREIGAEAMPPVIFTTAYDHAVAAFDLAAIDYLIKPFDDERFEKAFRRARKMIELNQVSKLSKDLRALLGAEETGRGKREERIPGADRRGDAGAG